MELVGSRFCRKKDDTSTRSAVLCQVFVSKKLELADGRDGHILLGSVGQNKVGVCAAVELVLGEAERLIVDRQPGGAATIRSRAHSISGPRIDHRKLRE